MSAKYTVRAPIVQKGMSTFAGASTDKLFLAGGMANQLYIHPTYPDLLRPTHDADFSRIPPMDSAGFNSLYHASLPLLSGYNPLRGKDREGFFIQLKEDESPFFLHVEKPTQRYWERVRETRERQFNTANEVYVPGTSSKLKVVRPEEIISAKLRRLGYLFSKGLLSPESLALYRVVVQRQFERLTENDFPNWLNGLMQLKASLSGHFEAGVEHGIKARQSYNGQKDLYDISLLARLITESKVSFDEKYFEETLDAVTIFS